MLIKWTPFAVRKLNHVYAYIYMKEQSHKLAEKQIDKILEIVNILKKHPDMGVTEPMLRDYKKEYRYLLEGNYKIIYRQQDHIIYIIDVFHTKQHPRKIKRNRGR